MPELGDTLGRYTLLKRLATGGMGEIFLAARMGPLGFAPPVALKVLRDELATDVSFIEMLVDEAKISMFLNHQNVVSVLDFGEENGRYYIAMEFVQGVTLKNILDSLKAKQRKMDLSTGAYIANELCRALKYAHTRTNHAGEPLNIVHRDVTPANVLVSIQGEVKLTDFGIARAKNRVHQTQAGVLKGKFGYMAPEMLRYEAIDARADLFCAGVILYEMACGQHPVEGASIMEAITRLEEKDIRPPSTYNQKVPRELDHVIMKALEPKPAQRWLSAHEISTAIQDLAFIEPGRRIETRHGSDQVTSLMRELFPTVFEPALPREHADKMFAVARERSSLLPPSPGKKPAANDQAQATHEDDSMPDMGARMSARPAINATPRPAINSPSSRHDASRAPTRLGDDDMPPTIIPRSGRQHTPATAAVMEHDTDEHAKNLLAEAARKHEDRTVNFSADDVDAAKEDVEVPTSELAIKFPDSSTDRSRLREELLQEPARPDRGDARAELERAHMDERTMASPNGYVDSHPEPQRDDATMMGMQVPEWDSMLPTNERAQAQVREPTTDQREEIRDFVEDELPLVKKASSSASYDDGATAFSGPEGYEPQASYSDDRTAFGMGSVSRGEESATIIPDEDMREDARPEKFGDDTLLDGLSSADVERAKQELGLARSKAQQAPRAQQPPPKAQPAPKVQKFEVQDDDMVADTNLRRDALREEAVSAAMNPPQPKKPHGRSASSASGERPSPAGPQAIALPPASSPKPVVSLKGGQPARPVAREAPRTAAAPPDPASRPPAAGQAPAEIGSATGRWMRGELQAQDLSWGDDAAARRAVATRNQPNSQPPPPARGPHVPGPRPGGLTAGGVMVQGMGQPTGMNPGMTPGMQVQPGMYPGQMQMGPNGMMGFPVPQQSAPRRASRGATVGLALATVMVAVAAVATVLLRTKIAWPEVTFETEPAGATVKIDDKLMAEKTTSTFAIRPNQAHRVEVKLDGYLTREIQGVDLGYFSTRSYQITLEKLMPKIRIVPVEGRVFVNDALVGAGSEVALTNIDPNIPLKVRVEADGYIAWSQTFAQLADVPAFLDVPLAAQPAPSPTPSPNKRR